MMPFRMLAPLVAAALCACAPATTPPAPDAGDTGPHDVCHPGPDAEGNAKHVGAYCSANGQECSQYHGATYACAIDVDPEGSNFCLILFCKSNDACGPDACCTGRGDSGPRACVPRACVVDHPDDPCPPWPLPADADAGTDEPDAGGASADAGQ